MSVHLGMDIGGTATRYVLCDDRGREVGRGKVTGATGHVFNPAEKEKLRRACLAVASTIDPAGHAVASVTAGVTGLGGAAAAQVRALMGEVFGTGQARTLIIDDIALAYVANFAPGQGHLVSAGTGSIGVHIDADGNITRVGGRGILIDDGGSGSWIALRALDRIYRALDEDGHFGSVRRLADTLLEQIGGTDWNDVRQFVYAGDRGRIGTLALAVAGAARAGDETARSILWQSGTELARLAQALIRRVGERPVGLIGGVLTLHPVILEAIGDALGPRELRMLDADASLVAARLQAGGHDAWRDTLAAMQAR